MISWEWIVLTMLVSLMIGYLLGLRWVVRAVKTGLQDKNSPIRSLVEGFLEQQATEEAEMYAKGAELFGEQIKCQNNCGKVIAGMFRETEFKRQAKERA
jgi:uncharacterized membrane-anchored protein YhcB (DUF1043 family)